MMWFTGMLVVLFCLLMTASSLWRLHFYPHYTATEWVLITKRVYTAGGL